MRAFLCLGVTIHGEGEETLLTPSQSHMRTAGILTTKLRFTTSYRYLNS